MAALMVVRARLRRAAFAVLLAGAVVLPGCGIFKPAVPEAPASAGIRLDYSSPDAVLETMSKGVEAKAAGGGQTAYSDAFADSTVDGIPYYATFVPEVKRRYESSGRLVPIWNFDLERRFFVDLASLRSENYLMRWTHDETMLNDDRGDQTTTLYRRYEIFATAPDGTTLGYVALGLADLQFQKTPRGRWAIVRWDDHADLVTSTLGTDAYILTMSARRLGIR